MKVWIHLCASCFLIGVITLLPVAADEEHGKPTEAKDNTGQTTATATATSSGTVDVTVTHDGNVDIESVLTKVADSLSTSDLSEAAKQRIIDKVRSGLEAKSQVRVELNGQVADGVGAANNRLPKTFQWKGGVWTDADGKQHRIDLKSAEGIEQQVADEIDSKIGAIRQLQADTWKRLSDDLNKQNKYAIGIALKYLEDQQPAESDADAVEKHDLDNATSKASETTLQIESVFEDSPAEKAGLKPGDILTRIDNMPIKQAVEVSDGVQDAGKADRTIKLEWTRNGEKLSAEIKPTNQPQSSPGNAAFQWHFRTDPSYVVPDANALMNPNFLNQLNPTLNQQHEVGELKKQVESLRDEIRELKELIQAGQSK